MTINVLMVIVSKGSDYITGPERRTLNLINNWKEFGVNVILCYPKNGALYHNFIKSNARVIDFQIRNKFDLIGLIKLIRIIKFNNTDIVHSQGAAANDLICSLASFFTRTRFVFSRLCILEDLLTYSYIRRYLYIILDNLITLRYASRIIAISYYGKDGLIRQKSKIKNKVTVIYNGINLERFYPKNTYNEISDEIHVGMVAHLSPEKGWNVFIEVINIAIKEGVKIHAHIIGEGEERGDIEHSIHDKKLSSFITLHGKKLTVGDLLNKLDIFLFTSRREGLSVAVLEAMATGLPIIASNVGAIREQIYDGQNGFVVDANDVEAYVEKLKYFYYNRCMLKKYGSNSRKIAEQKFDEKTMLYKYLKVYNNE